MTNIIWKQFKKKICNLKAGRNGGPLRVEASRRRGHTSVQPHSFVDYHVDYFHWIEKVYYFLRGRGFSFLPHVTTSINSPSLDYRRSENPNFISLGGLTTRSFIILFIGRKKGEEVRYGFKYLISIFGDAFRIMLVVWSWFSGLNVLIDAVNFRALCWWLVKA